MHLMALHKVHVQIDYRARLPYHTAILMTADSALLLTLFVVLIAGMNYFLQKVVLHDPW